MIRKKGQVLAQLGPGDYFGEMSFIDVPRRSASAVVSRRKSLWSFVATNFLQLF